MPETQQLRTVGQSPTDAAKLLAYFVQFPRERHDSVRGISGRLEVEAVCMNPEKVCFVCIFSEGHMAKWCTPAERAAKAEGVR